jgi:hypothetical protein
VTDSEAEVGHHRLQSESVVRKLRGGPVAARCNHRRQRSVAVTVSSSRRWGHSDY